MIITIIVCLMLLIIIIYKLIIRVRLYADSGLTFFGIDEASGA